MPNANRPLVGLIVGFLIGVLGGLIVTWFGVQTQSQVDYQFGQMASKMDVLRRFAANRYVMTEIGPGIQSNGEPFVALNEAFVVFARDPEVIEALETMHAELEQPGRLVENIVTLVKEMADAADVPVDLNDSFIRRPFTPPRQ